MIEFGRNLNQLAHTFRHVEAWGLRRDEVGEVVTAHLQQIERSMFEGAYTGFVQVKGVALEFRAYKFSNGDIHVGRITIC